MKSTAPQNTSFASADSVPTRLEDLRKRIFLGSDDRPISREGICKAALESGLFPGLSMPRVNRNPNCLHNYNPHFHGRPLNVYARSSHQRQAWSGKLRIRPSPASCLNSSQRTALSGASWERLEACLRKKRLSLHLPKRRRRLDSGCLEWTMTFYDNLMNQDHRGERVSLDEFWR